MAYQFIFLILTSHFANRPHFVTQELPNAYLNQPYYAKIEIESVILEESVGIKVLNENIVVAPRFYEAWRDIYDEPVYRNNYSDLTITGTPTKLEPITIKIIESNYDNIFVGKEF